MRPRQLHHIRGSHGTFCVHAMRPKTQDRLHTHSVIFCLSVHQKSWNKPLGHHTRMQSLSLCRHFRWAPDVCYRRHCQWSIQLTIDTSYPPCLYQCVVCSKTTTRLKILKLQTTLPSSDSIKPNMHPSWVFMHTLLTAHIPYGCYPRSSPCTISLPYP